MNRLQKVLRELGDSAREVADNIAKVGIKGKPMDCKNCPIAKYLRQQGFIEIKVGIETGIDARDNDIVIVNEPHTLATEVFVNNFDNGMYATLQDCSCRANT